MRERFGVNLLRQGQPGAAGFRQTDQLCQPGRARRLDVQPGMGPRQRPADWRVKRKLVAAGMNAQFQVRRQSVFFDGERNHGEVGVKLLFKLGHVPDIIDAFVEAAGELWRDGLHGDAFVGDGGENHQQFRRCLWPVRFVHGNFRDKAGAFGLLNVPVNASGFLHRAQVLADDAPNVGARNLQGHLDAWDFHAPDQFAVSINKRFHLRIAGRAANEVGHVHGEKIRVRDEPVHRFKADMIRVHVIGLFPFQFAH